MMSRTALFFLSLMVGLSGCVAPSSLEGLVVALSPSTPDNVNVVPIVVKAPLAQDVSYRYVWTTDSTNAPVVDVGNEWGSSVPNWATLPGETWTVEVIPFLGRRDAPLAEGPGAVSETLITDAGRDSDNDGDGFTENQGDCDDTEIDIFPGVDRDADGFMGCLSPFQTGSMLDCDDLDAQINPGRNIDGDVTRPLIDDDCDGLIDEDAVLVGDFVITEIMNESNEVGAEWIEVLHLGADLRSLGGWEIATEHGDATIPSVDADGAGFLVLCPNPAAANSLEVPCANEAPFTNVLTGAQDVVLAIPETQEGITVLHRVPLEVMPQEAGTSTQLSAGSTASLSQASDPENWCLSTVAFAGELGSPGVANTDCPVP